MNWNLRLSKWLENHSEAILWFVLPLAFIAGFILRGGGIETINPKLE